MSYYWIQKEIKNWEKRYSLANIITILLFPIAAMCRSTWREENKIYVLHSFKSYKSRFNNHFQYFTLKKKLFNKYYHCSSFPNRCHYICRSIRHEEKKSVIIYDLITFDFIYVLGPIGVFADIISDVIFTNLHDNKQILGWQ